MNIEVKQLQDCDFMQVQNLTEELYAELGEPTADIPRLTEKFINTTLNCDSCMVLLFRSFVTREPITIATLTASNALANGSYAVLDEIYTRREFRSLERQPEVEQAIRSLALLKGWNRIDIATPTDAWHRTVRFHPNLSLKLTSPKFKHVIRSAA